jgi:hypothetical protein
MFLCFYGNVLVTSFTVILRPLDYGTATRGNPGLRRPRRMWVDNINMDLRKVGWGGMDCINLVQDRDRWSLSCEHGNETSGSTNAGNF